MASINKAIIIGHLGQDPDTRYSPDGKAITNISVATTGKWKDKQSGEMREATEWHRIAFFDRLAEVAGEYLKKGSQVYVEGKITTNKWTDKDGIDRYTTQIVASSLVMLGGNQEATERQQSKPAKQQQKQSANNIAEMDDDIPFN